MAEKRFYVDINLLQNELKGAVIERVDVLVTGVEGQIVYNNNDNLLYINDGTTWVPVGDTPIFVDGEVVTRAGVGNELKLDIVDGVVTALKLATDAVEEDKILDGAVTQDKLGDKAVSLAKMDDMPTERIIGRVSALTGIPEYLTKAQMETFLGLSGYDSDLAISYPVGDETAEIVDNNSTSGAITIRKSTIAQAGLMTKAQAIELQSWVDSNKTAIAIDMTAGVASVSVNGNSADIGIRGTVTGQDAGLMLASDYELLTNALQGIAFENVVQSMNSVTVDIVGATNANAITAASTSQAGVMTAGMFDDLYTALQFNGGHAGAGFTFGVSMSDGPATITLAGLQIADLVGTIDEVSATKSGLMTKEQKLAVEGIINIDKSKVVFRTVSPGSPDEANYIHGNLSAEINWIDDSNTLGGVAPSDNIVSTQKAVKEYVDAAVTALGTFEGGYNATTDETDSTPPLKLEAGPNTDVQKGDYWIVTTAGPFFGGSAGGGDDLESGDTLIAKVPAPAVFADWTIVHGGIGDATESIKGKVELATQTEALDGVIVGPYAITPVTLRATLGINGKPDNSSESADDGKVLNARRYTTNIGDGSNDFATVTHGLNNKFVATQIYDANGQVELEVTLTDANTLKVTSNSTMAANEFRVVVIG